MRMGDVQNSIGRSFEVQALAQQATLAGETAVRQTERQLAREHTRQESQVSAQSETQAGEDLSIDRAPQQPDPRRGRRRYFTRYSGIGPLLVEIIDDDPAPSPSSSPHLDIIA